jgi:hypothetical protein
MQKHFVTFYSPGTFVAEESQYAIDSWDIEWAQKKAEKITERYGATPYAFQFSTRSRKDNDLDSSITKRSGMYFINCKAETLAQIKARKDPKDKILIANMEGNGWPTIVTTTKGWKWTQPVRKGDVVLGAETTATPAKTTNAKTPTFKSIKTPKKTGAKLKRKSITKL